MSLTTTRRSGDQLGNLRRLNSMLEDAFSGWPFLKEGAGAITSAWVPACDIVEDNDAVKIVAEVPGVRPEDVKLSLENNIITIRGEKRHQHEEKAGQVHRFERSYGAFEQSFALPNSVDAEKIEASYEGGLLTVTLPRAEKAKPREIQVRTTA